MSTLHTRWASVNKREWPATGRYSHVVEMGKPTSLCGTTAFPVTLWRAAPRKPQCPECLRRMEAKA